MNHSDIIVDLLGISITFCTPESITRKIEYAVAKREALTISYANKYIVLSARKNICLQNNLSKINLLYQDGTGVYWAGRLFSSLTPGNMINATDTNFSVLEFANKNKMKVFFFGGSKVASECISKVIEEKYPNIYIAGVLARVEIFTDKIIDEIKKSDAEILFVGLGTPYQEEWLANYAGQVDIPVQIGVGSWLEFLAGRERRAPTVMQRIGMEWFYRMIQNPPRLLKRYVLGIPIFLFLVIKRKILGA